MSDSKESAVENTQQPIKGFKGFDRDMKCRGFQFEEGQTYKHDGEVKACSSGFHFCENPLDVFGYYSPGESVFREVEGGGEYSRHSDDSKVAVSEIKIGVELSPHNFIASGIKFLFERKYTESDSSHSTGYSSAAVCTGVDSKAMCGPFGIIALQWRNKKEERREMRCAEIGCGDGSDGKLKANVWYSLDENGRFLEF